MDRLVADIDPSINAKLPTPKEKPCEKSKACDELGTAVKGTLGDIVAKHEKLILTYYRDVQRQAMKSFNSAKTVAQVGFCVLIITLAYVIIWSSIHHGDSGHASIEVGTVGVISGILIEFIAAINFHLYGKVSRQFGAFHICLERTHRYLIAYKISESIEAEKDATLQKLVCIMANAPMISMQDINETGRNELVGNRTESN